MSERGCGARAHLDGWTEVGELGLTATVGLVVKIHEGVEHTRPRPHVDLVRDRVVVRVVERSWLVLEHLESLEVLCANRGAKHFKKSVLKVAVNLRVELFLLYRSVSSHSTCDPHIHAYSVQRKRVEVAVVVVGWWLWRWLWR